MKYLVMLVFITAFREHGLVAQQTSNPRLPAVIHECDIIEAFGINACTDWKVDGVGHYSVQAPDGSHTSIHVVYFDQNAIAAKALVDVGPNAGLTGTYQGRIQNGRIDGTFEISRLGMTFGGIWKGTIEGAASASFSDYSSPANQSNAEPQQNLILKAHGPAGQVPTQMRYADGPAGVTCLYAKQERPGPNDGPAKCEVSGPRIPIVLLEEGHSTRISQSEILTLTCRGVGNLSCSIRTSLRDTNPVP